MNTTPPAGFLRHTTTDGRTVDFQHVRLIRAAGNSHHGYTDHMWQVHDLNAPAGTRYVIADGLTPADATRIAHRLNGCHLVHNPATGSWSVRAAGSAPHDPDGLIGAPGRRLAASRADALAQAAAAVLTGTDEPAGRTIDVNGVPA